MTLAREIVSPHPMVLFVTFVQCVLLKIVDSVRREVALHSAKSPRQHSVDTPASPRYCTPTIEVARGDLPPIAATLNKVLKRDAPGGLSRPGDFRFTARGTRSDPAARQLDAENALNDPAAGGSPLTWRLRARHVARVRNAH